jgi:hypothetical protein
MNMKKETFSFPPFVQQLAAEANTKLLALQQSVVPVAVYDNILAEVLQSNGVTPTGDNCSNLAFAVGWLHPENTVMCA